ncbi:hypothetical protein A2U01_0075226 [Trifolium medium]|uniref:Uncharacterized protein n=1 Tax=Trifolium medium TaxID=97028 RepID=A0A392SZ54_9FABA|nr:hypothetical protein [Trifolium medium]
MTGENKSGAKFLLARLGDSWRAYRYLSPMITRRPLKNTHCRWSSLQGSPGDGVCS